MFDLNSGEINVLKQSVKLSRLVVSISSAIPFLGNHLFQEESPKPVLFSVMVFRAVFRSSNVLKTPANFFYSPLKADPNFAPIAWKHLIGPPWVSLFTNQSGYCVLLPFFALNFLVSALNYLISASNLLKTAFP